jgi:hypothetical protein
LPERESHLLRIRARNTRTRSITGECRIPFAIFRNISRFLVPTTSHKSFLPLIRILSARKEKEKGNPYIGAPPLAPSPELLNLSNPKSEKTVILFRVKLAMN